MPHYRKLAVALVVGAAALAPATPAGAANIAANPGFESGLAGWTCASSARVVGSPVHGGASALEATPVDQDLARCQQTISVQPGSAYRLSAWVRGNYVFVGATGAGMSEVSTWAAPGAAWAQASTTFTTGATTSSVTIYVNGWYGQGTYHADDVVLDGAPGGGGGPDTTPPSVPGNLTVGSPTASSLRLDWTAATDNSGTIARYDVSRDNGAPVSAGATTTFSATGLAASTTYSFRARACDAAGNCSAYSPAVSGTTSSTGPPPTGSLPRRVLRGNAAQFFPALRADQVAIGLPAAPLAGNGFTTVGEVQRAFDCLARATNCGSYRPARAHPDLRGLMTWSINWDRFNGFEFSRSHRSYLNALP